jgi:hypothetical protein
MNFTGKTRNQIKKDIVCTDNMTGYSKGYGSPVSVTRDYTFF